MAVLKEQCKPCEGVIHDEIFNRLQGAAMISAADFAVAGPQLASLLGAEHPTTDAWQWQPLPSSVFRRSKVTA